MYNKQVKESYIEFAEDLRKIMIKHGVMKIRMASYGEIVITKNDGIKLEHVDIDVKEESLDVGHLSIDECLDLHNQMIHAFHLTKVPAFENEAKEIMAYIKRRFWKVDA
jgi:hypothetical protein